MYNAKQMHRCRKQTRGYQRRERRAHSGNRMQTLLLETQTTVYKIDKEQEYLIWCSDYSHHLVITFNGTKSVKILNHYVVIL